MERQLKELELLEKVALAAYEAVDKEYQEAQIKSSYAEGEVRRVAEAVPPQYPSSPTLLIFAVVSLLSGLVIGACLAFVLEYLNRSVRSVRDVEHVVGVKVLATIPRISADSSRLAAA
jgi:capsular polysaccharide biosynthesis protein